MRIAVLGGAFDPIHNGHLQIAKQALKQLRVDEVWFMPSAATPLKQDAGCLLFGSCGYGISCYQAIPAYEAVHAGASAGGCFLYHTYGEGAEKALSEAFLLLADRG
ncbi:MAG: nicotinate-nicotinamide nucleotide adenylyltransferase [[Clostridium] innocuum]